MNFEDYESLPTNNVLVHMTAGAIAGVMEHCVMYPLDSVKTRMQSLAAPGSTDGIIDTFTRMVRHEGLFRPVRGLTAMIVGAGPSHALYFSSYEYLKTTMTQNTSNPRYHTAIYGAAGCIATVLHDGVMNPSEVVKQRMQMVNSPYKSAISCFIDIYKRERLGAFYRSYTTQLTMNIPFQSIHFMVYEFAQKRTNPSGQYNPAAHMVSGAAAGGIAAALTTPLDVCKTLLNTQQIGATSGLKEAVRKVYAIGGPMGYFRGMQARVWYTMPATAICWSTYEFFKYMLSGTAEVRLGTAILAESEPAAAAGGGGGATGSISNHSGREGGERINVKPRELPAMSGAGIYGAISFNTMHTATSNDATYSRRNDALHDIVHT